MGRVMFELWHDGKLIGWSGFDAGGDAPMGCAKGLFKPAIAFEEFRVSIPAEQYANYDDIKNWYGLTLKTADGRSVACSGGIALSEADFGDHIEREVVAVGIPYPLYEELFPEYVRRYKEQFD